MEFEDFQKEITEGLQKIYGDGMEIVTDSVLKNNGSKYHGIYIFQKNSERKACPVINLDNVYEAFKHGVSLGDCVYVIYLIRRTLRNPEGVEMIVEVASDWEQVKDNVYPVLISTEENQEMLEDLISKQMLDLAVVYSIRIEVHGKGTLGIKISPKLLEGYGISIEQLHEQAMKNLEKDGYEFLDMSDLIESVSDPEESEEDQETEYDPDPEMYILTNRTRIYGAAGILNKKLIKEFAKGRDFIILPSSVHEILFVPVGNRFDQKVFDIMVSTVNMTEVDAEERLADHSYYYDAEANEIRICA